MKRRSHEHNDTHNIFLRTQEETRLRFRRRLRNSLTCFTVFALDDSVFVQRAETRVFLTCRFVKRNRTQARLRVVPEMQELSEISHIKRIKHDCFLLSVFLQGAILVRDAIEQGKRCLSVSLYRYEQEKIVRREIKKKKKYK